MAVKKEKADMKEHRKKMQKKLDQLHMDLKQEKEKSEGGANEALQQLQRSMDDQKAMFERQNKDLSAQLSDAMQKLEAARGGADKAAAQGESSTGLNQTEKLSLVDVMKAVSQLELQELNQLGHGVMMEQVRKRMVAEHKRLEAHYKQQYTHSLQLATHSLQQQVRNLSECTVCLDGNKDTAFQCGHTACGTCARDLLSRKADCHICRAKITRLLALFDS